MEKCPKCDKWTLSLDLIKERAFCYNCKYERKINYNEYKKKNDLMPKLSRSLKLNGYKV